MDAVVGGTAVACGEVLPATGGTKKELNDNCMTSFLLAGSGVVSSVMQWEGDYFVACRFLKPGTVSVA